MALNDWDDVDPDSVHLLPDHEVADAPEDDLPTAHAGGFAADDNVAHNDANQPDQRMAGTADDNAVPTGEEDL